MIPGNRLVAVLEALAVPTHVTNAHSSSNTDTDRTHVLMIAFLSRYQQIDFTHNKRGKYACSTSFLQVSGNVQVEEGQQ